MTKIIIKTPTGDVNLCANKSLVRKAQTELNKQTEKEFWENSHYLNVLEKLAKE